MTMAMMAAMTVMAMMAMTPTMSTAVPAGRRGIHGRKPSDGEGESGSRGSENFTVHSRSPGLIQGDHRAGMSPKVWSARRAACDAGHMDALSGVLFSHSQQ
jgi:hypothetical protein